MKKIIITPGYPSGLLRAVKIDHTDDKGEVWDCVCRCGQHKLVPERHLKSQLTKSCGCLKEAAWKRNAKLGRGSPQITLDINGSSRTLTLKAALKKYLRVSLSEYRRRRAEGWDYQAAIRTPHTRQVSDVKDTIKVFGEHLSRSEAVRRFAVVSRQQVYSRVKSGMSWEQALVATPQWQRCTRCGSTKGNTPSCGKC